MSGIVKLAEVGGGAPPTVELGPDFGNPTELESGVDITQLSVTVGGGFRVTKDAYSDATAVCVDVNHDGDFLQIDSTAATQKEIFIGWDVSGMPTGATVTSATVQLQTQNVSALAQTLGIHLIPTGSEGWTEAGIVCSNRPASEGEQTTLTLSNAAESVEIISFTSGMRTRLASRMGVGTFTLLLRMNSALASRTFYDTENGAGATAPTLLFTFTLPV